MFSLENNFSNRTNLGFHFSMTPAASHPYAFLALFLLIAIAFPLALLLVARAWEWIFQPAKPSAVKSATYECGLPVQGGSRIQFKAHYYLYAIMFLIFDVEVLFLLPLAVTFTGLPTAALFAILVFILLLAEGLVWAWNKGYLEWK